MAAGGAVPTPLVAASEYMSTVGSVGAPFCSQQADSGIIGVERVDVARNVVWWEGRVCVVTAFALLYTFQLQVLPAQGSP